mmetsp:Transcript_50677/g.130704  ORF Transcript_50677/g.130704 Transcript_50677/m.130704 type:complete len:246 (-) Transcript_50677:355-1092(-)
MSRPSVVPLLVEAQNGTDKGGVVRSNACNSIIAGLFGCHASPHRFHCLIGGEEAHHHITVSSCDSRSNTAVCIRPCPSYRRVAYPSVHFVAGPICSCASYHPSISTYHSHADRVVIIVVDISVVPLTQPLLSFSFSLFLFISFLSFFVFSLPFLLLLLIFSFKLGCPRPAPVQAMHISIVVRLTVVVLPLFIHVVRGGSFGRFWLEPHLHSKRVGTISSQQCFCRVIENRARHRNSIPHASQIPD